MLTTRTPVFILAVTDSTSLIVAILVLNWIRRVSLVDVDLTTLTTFVVNDTILGRRSVLEITSSLWTMIVSSIDLSS
jgi:hypothetical protein